MKSISILLVAAILYSCNENKKPTSGGDQPFFQFDRIEYYHTPLSTKDIRTIELNPEKNRKEQALLQIVSGDIPVSIKDTLFIRNMEVLGFEKDTIDSKLNPKISHLFSFREVSKPVAPRCKSGFRDILIFRRENRIIGMAKINFECAAHQMIGERYNDSNFGQSGEYKELEAILTQYKKH